MGRAERSTQQMKPVIRKTADRREGRGGEGREEKNTQRAGESEQTVTVKLLSSWEADQGPH